MQLLWEVGISGHHSMRYDSQMLIKYFLITYILLGPMLNLLVQHHVLLYGHDIKCILHSYQDDGYGLRDIYLLQDYLIPIIAEEVHDDLLALTFVHPHLQLQQKLHLCVVKEQYQVVQAI